MASSSERERRIDSKIVPTNKSSVQSYIERDGTFRWNETNLQHGLDYAPISALKQRWGDFIWVRSAREATTWDVAPMEWLIECPLLRRCTVIVSAASLTKDQQAYAVRMCQQHAAWGLVEWWNQHCLDSQTMLICTSPHLDESAMQAYCKLLRSEHIPLLLWWSELSSVLELAALTMTRATSLLHQLDGILEARQVAFQRNQAACRLQFPDLALLHAGMDAAYEKEDTQLLPDAKTGKLRMRKLVFTGSHSWQELNHRVAQWAQHVARRLRTPWPALESVTRPWCLAMMRCVLEQCHVHQSSWTADLAAPSGDKLAMSAQMTDQIACRLIRSLYGPLLIKHIREWLTTPCTVSTHYIEQALMQLTHIEMEQYARTHMSWNPTLRSCPFLLSQQHMADIVTLCAANQVVDTSDHHFERPKPITSRSNALRRLVAFAGSEYICELDLTCSFVTGSALSVALVQTPVERACETLEQFLAIYYPVMVTHAYQATDPSDPPAGHAPVPLLGLIRPKTKAMTPEKLAHVDVLRSTLFIQSKTPAIAGATRNNPSIIHGKPSDTHIHMASLLERDFQPHVTIDGVAEVKHVPQMQQQQQQPFVEAMAVPHVHHPPPPQQQQQPHGQIRPLQQLNLEQEQQRQAWLQYQTARWFAHVKCQDTPDIHHHLPIARAEYGSDVDIAIDVPDWPTFDRIVQQHLQTICKFIPNARLEKVSKAGREQQHISSTPNLAANTQTVSNDDTQRDGHSYTYRIINTDESDLIRDGESWTDWSRRVMRPIELYRSGMARIAAHHFPMVRAAWTAHPHVLNMEEKHFQASSQHEHVPTKSTTNAQFVMTASCAHAAWTGRIHTLHYLVSHKHNPVDMLMKWIQRGYRMLCGLDIPNSLFETMSGAHDDIMNARYIGGVSSYLVTKNARASQIESDEASWKLPHKSVPNKSISIIRRLPILCNWGVGNIMALEHEVALARHLGLRISPLTSSRQDEWNASMDATSDYKTNSPSKLHTSVAAVTHLLSTNRDNVSQAGASATNALPVLRHAGSDEDDSGDEMRDQHADDE